MGGDNLIVALGGLLGGVVAGAAFKKRQGLAPDVEYLLRRAEAVREQQGAQPDTSSDTKPGKKGASGNKGKSSSGGSKNVTLDHLLVAMKETGAATKVAAAAGPAKAAAEASHAGPGPSSSAPTPIIPAASSIPLPQPSGDGGLTKKDLEETMRSMLAPPGQSFGPDGDSALDRFTKDLTMQARMGKLDPVICRDDEIRRVVHILSRRTKNNPVLIGESGVGKTAVVEGLALRIVAGDVPDSLRGVKILELDLGSLTAGCMMPGEFEERLKAVLNEIGAMGSRAILFIDDIHNLVPPPGGGATMMDGGSLLKPALSRGELRCIGASGVDKFKKTIEKDPALERRFQQVMIEQPTVPQTISILRGLRARYENYHGVDITEGALVAAATLSARYISGRFLPDKAIDLMDEATAQVKMESSLKPEAQDQLERKLEQLAMEERSLKGKAEKDRTAAACLTDVLLAKASAQQALDTLKQQIEDKKRKEKEAAEAERIAKGEPEEESLEAKEEKLHELRSRYEALMISAAEAARHEDYETEEDNKEEASALLKQIDAAQRDVMMTAMKRVNGHAHGEIPYGAIPMSGWPGQKRHQVSEGEVAKVISRWTGIPVAKLVAGEREKLLGLTDELHRRIIGQHEAVEAVAEAVQRSRADLADPNGPIASFMFLGPTGVGKTELAKALAAYLFNTEDALVRLDMSEYMEKHAVSRLIGAPPGYVGYDEGGMLTDAVRRKPYSVVLFDEIEKAHVDVFNVLLQILDDGRVTDTQGRTVSFKNTVIIMTSNLGSSEIFEQLGLNTKGSASGSEAGTPNGKAAQKDWLTVDERRLVVKEKVMEHVRSHFRPEFVNRVDDFITFEPLQPDQIKQIVVLRAQKLVTRLAERRIKLELSDSAVEHLAKVGFDPVFGARPVKRALQRELQTLLAKSVLRNEFEEDDIIVVEAADDEDGDAAPRPGDGNYKSGLVLKKGSRADPTAAVNGNAAVPDHQTNGHANGHAE